MVRSSYRNKLRPCLPSTNSLGIPDLIPELCVTAAGSLKLLPYRSVRFDRVDCTKRILSFFVDDYRFRSLWSYYHRVVMSIKAAKFHSIIEPDFSLWVDRPVAEQILAVYKTRWIGRYAQEHGILVIPNLNWSDTNSFEFAWHGVPEHVPMVAVEVQSCRGEHAAFNEGLAAGCAKVKPKQLLVYGGDRPWLRIPQGVTPLFVSAFSNKFRV